MWFRSWFDTFHRRSSRKTKRPVKHTADRRRQARRHFVEGLEDRSLMAFNVLAEYAATSNLSTLLLTQIDAGAQPDLVIPDYYGSSVGVQLGNADGTFGPVQSSPAGGNPLLLAAGDFTGDGAVDLVTANVADISLLAGNGDGTFQPATSISLPGLFPPGYTDPAPLAQYPQSVATGDLNGDGKLDLVVASETSYRVFRGSGYYGNYYDYYNDGYVNVLLGNGAGGFGPAQTHHLGSGRLPGVVAVSDINGDGNADVITANGGDLSVLLGNGTGAVADPINSGSGYPLRSISLGDVDGDGKVDTLLNNGGNVTVQKGDGLGGFMPSTTVGTGRYMYSAVMGDVNADGKLDLVTVDSLNSFTCTGYGYYGGCYSGYYKTSREANVFLGSGLGNFASPLTSSLGSELGYGYLTDVALADLTGDGLPDLVAMDPDFAKSIVATNDGNWHPPAAIAISDATVVEGNAGTRNAVFTVTAAGEHGDVSVHYATANNTAAAGADYTATSGTLTFAANESSKTISVPIIGDMIDEYDEQFFVNLSNPVGGLLNDAQGVGTIQDDDAAPLVTINDVSKSEGNSGNTSFVFTVSLSAASGKYVSVNFATANGTATTADSDYVAASGIVNFAPGQTTATLTVTVRSDKKKEANETFFVNLTGATDGTLADSQGIGTILNDDNGNGSGGGNGKPQTR